MNFYLSFLLAGFLSTAGVAVGQTAPSPSPTPMASSFAEPASIPGDARVRREQAFVKLLEGQKLLWSSHRLQTQAGKSNAMRLAKAAFQKAVEFDPTLAEAYTALAELAVAVPPADIEESIRLAATATKLSPNNFGGYRMLGRLYTVKSRLNSGTLDPVFAAKAVEAWKHVTQLDPRNAEGWAFLSAFSARKNETADQIEFLKKWIASASPSDVQFYGGIMGAEESLTPERASLKLGAAYMKAGRKDEAVETLSTLIADDAANAEAIDLLSEAIDSSEGAGAAAAIESLSQAVFANPDNVALINMLAVLHSRTGRFADAVKLLRASALRIAPGDGRSASALLVTLGDLYIGQDKYADAAETFENALSVRGTEDDTALATGDYEFVTYVFEKLIQAYKLANRPADVNKSIEKARAMLGKNDLFSDRQLISFYRSTGNRTGALDHIKAVRAKFPRDNSFLRLEAGLLAETGKVEAAVALIRAEMARKPASVPVGTKPPVEGDPDSVSVMLPGYDEFSNQLFISNLYSKANRSKDAADAANQAYVIALGSERKQIARLTLATAQQMGGDFKAAETTLRDILKETPRNPIALNNLGYFLVERDERFAEAVELIQQALKIDPKNPSYLDSLGWAYFKLGKLDDAEKYLKDAARLETESATIYEHLGDVYAKKQNVEMARSTLQKALRLASDAADIERIKKKLLN